VVSRTAVATLALTAVVLLGLLAYLQVDDKNGKQALVLKDADTVKQIEVFAPDLARSNQSQQTNPSAAQNHVPDWVLTRDGETWSIQVKQRSEEASLTKGLNTTTSIENTLTITIAADKNRVAPLLALLQLPDRKSYAVTEVDLEELGLQPPQAVVTLDQLNFSFGNLSVDGSARYVQVNDSIHLYQEFAFPLISAGANAFVQQDTDATEP